MASKLAHMIDCDLVSVTALAFVPFSSSPRAAHTSTLHQSMNQTNLPLIGLTEIQSNKNFMTAFLLYKVCINTTAVQLLNVPTASSIRASEPLHG